MTLIKKTLCCALVISATSSALANEVDVNNTSNRPIPVQYQEVYNNYHGGPVIVKDISRTIINPHSSLKIQVQPSEYNNAGVIIKAVKKGPKDTEWYNLPASATAYNTIPGCWAKTDSKQEIGNINLLYSSSTQNKQGMITCSTKTSL